MKKKISEAIRADSEIIEEALNKYLSRSDEHYPELFEAMRYGVLNGGKRVRPFLAIEFCRMFKGKTEDVIPFACAVELIHSYSLIHDDLPCMDNDDLRRGKPTAHVKFGEANALLAGDALLTYAFGVASSNDNVKPEYTLKAVKLLSEYAGQHGMIGGQQLDLDAENKKIDLDTLKYLHSLKTGCLIKAACLLGCLAAGDNVNRAQLEDAAAYAENIGLTFQIIDDILDMTGDEKTLGKPIGSDLEQQKTTFLSFMSVKEAYSYASELTVKAKKAIEKYENSDILCDFADYLLTRNK